MTTRDDERELIIARLERLDEAETRACEQSFAQFVRAAWRVLEPVRPLVWGWHHDLACGELEEVSAGHTTHLLINEPPGTMKSLLASVFFNAWEWGPRKMPHLRYMCASHEQTLSTRDNRRVRDLIRSTWFQARWPLDLREDQNQVTKFETAQGGWRIGTSVGGRGMGEHPHRKIIDDAHDPRRVPTDLEREKVWNWYTGFWAMRGGAMGGAEIVIGQRLHEDDLSGKLMRHKSFAGRKGFVHVCLPMRYVPPKKDPAERAKQIVPMKPTPSGRIDLRTTPGELLCPELLPEEVVDANEALLDEDGTAAQHQQMPGTGRRGRFLERSWFRIIEARPHDVKMWVRFWDVAGTEGGTGAETAGVLMGLREAGRFVIADLVSGRWADDEVDLTIHTTAKLDGKEVLVREEREPGSSGKAVVRMRARSLPGYDYADVAPVSDKETRAKPLRIQAKAGNVDLVCDTDARREKMQKLMDEGERFPRGVIDIIDAAAGALNVLVDEQGMKKKKITSATWGRR